MAKKYNPNVVDNIKKLMRSLNHLELKSVYVGIPAEKTERDAGDDGDDGPMNNATLGYIHEHGSPAANIPARPFMEPGIKDGAPLIEKYLRQAGSLQIKGATQDKVDRQLHLAGLAAQNAVRAVINAGVPPPLADSTLAARKRRGFKGEKSLIVTGQLRNAITYVVKEEEK